MNTPLALHTLALIALGSPAAMAQPLLYTAGAPDPYSTPLVSGFTSAGGERAPYGSSWSELASGSASAALAGVSVHGGVPGGAYRVADWFTIPPGQVWKIAGFRAYAYQPGGSAKQSPVVGFNLRVWSGRPSDPGSVVLFGDAGTNRLGSAAFANLFRTFATRGGRAPAATDRPVWAVTTTGLDLVLPPGTYWLDYQFVSRDPDRPLFTPPLLDSASASLTPGPADRGGAIHLQPVGIDTAWLPIEDPGLNGLGVGAACRLPVQILGTPLTGGRADLADASGRPGRDGATDLGDLLAFMGAYERSEPLADLCGESGPDSPPDGRVTPADLVAFIAAYAGGE